MKLRSIVAMLTCVAIMSGWVPQARAVPPSILANYGAESGSLTGWTSEVTDEPWTVTSSDAYEGTKSFLSGNGTSTLTQTVDLIGLGYTEAQLDSITGVSLSAWVKGNDDEGETDTYDMGLYMLGSGLGAMALTSLGDPHTAPADWTERQTGLGNYGPGMRYLRVLLTSSDGAGTSGNHGVMFDNVLLAIADDSHPTLASVSPADGATNLSLSTSELTLHFSEAVTVNVGDIVVHRASDDSAAATIDITSDAVTGSGTSDITVTLPNALLAGTAYYVTIDEGAFVDAWNNTYAGISTETDWDFRMRSSGSSVVGITSPIRDTSITNVQATVSASNVELRWQEGGDVPAARIFASLDNLTWEPISTYLIRSSSYTWHIPESYTNKEVTFLIEATDLAARLSSATSTPILMPGETETAPESIPDSITPEPGLTTHLNIHPGSYIRAVSWPTVYFISHNGQRRPFLNEHIFSTYADNFDAVITVSDAEIANYPIGGAMGPKPGTTLVKVQSVPKVFALVGTPESPEFRWIASESLATELYGAHWADYVIDLPPTMWSHLTFGQDVTTTNDLNVDLSILLRREELGSL